MAVITAYMYGFAVPRPPLGTRHLQWEASEEFMIRDLAASGLEAGDVKAYPLCLNLPRDSEAAYVLPYYDLQGRVLADAQTGVTGRMHRIKCLPNQRLTREQLKKFSKYTQPSRAQLGADATIPYILPSWWAGTGRHFIVEGEKKAAALAKRWKVGAIGLGGCSNWRHPDPEDHGLHPWIEEAIIKARVQTIVIVPDGDVRRMDINRQYRGLAERLVGMGLTVEVVNFSLMNPDKLDDWLMDNPAEGSVDVVDTWERFDIRDMAENREDLIRTYSLLARGEARVIIPNDYNVATLINNHPAYRGQFRVNTDTLQLLPPPAMGGDFSMSVYAHETTVHMQSVMGITDCKLGTVKAAIAVAAERNAVSPIMEWLEGLVWDGVERLNGWMVKYLNAEDNDFTYEVGGKALIAAVARRYNPGTPVDYMTILQGAQGIGKSGAIRLLFGAPNTLEYSRGGVEGKDALLAWHRSWCVADEELKLGRLADANALKAVITTRNDVFRVPYGVDAREYPRKFVMWGSTNEEEPLRMDPSGYRRFAIVRMLGKDKINFDALSAVRDQLWAEAVWHYKNSEIDYSMLEGASANAERFVSISLAEEHIVAYLERGQGNVDSKLADGSVCYRMLDIVMAVYGPNYSRIQELECANILRKLGYVKKTMRHGKDKRLGKVWMLPK